MDLVPDNVLSEHLLPLLSFRDAFRLYSSCLRFRLLLSDRLVPRLKVLREGGNLRDAMKGAVRGVFLDLVRFLVDEMSLWDWDKGMCWAAEVGCLDLVEYFVARGASEWYWGMRDAVSGGHWDLVEYFVGKGFSNWDWGMSVAARWGNRDLVEYFIARGASNWNRGMRQAAGRGKPKDTRYQPTPRAPAGIRP